MRIPVYLCLLTAVATVLQAAEVRTLDFSLRNERETACEEVVRVSLPVPAGSCQANRLTWFAAVPGNFLPRPTSLRGTQTAPLDG